MLTRYLIHLYSWNLFLQEELRRRLHARIEMARFLQDTVKEMAKEVQDSRSGEIKKTAEDLDEFINKVKRSSVTYSLYLYFVLMKVLLVKYAC